MEFTDNQKLAFRGMIIVFKNKLKDTFSQERNGSVYGRSIKRKSACEKKEAFLCEFFRRNLYGESKRRLFILAGGRTC